MTSLKRLAMYCRDYIDLISPSLLSRQAKQIVIPKNILDATPLYEKSADVDYELLSFTLNLEPKVDDLSIDNEFKEIDTTQGLDEEEKLKLEIAKSLDDIYRKYETNTYTKQVALKFGRVSFLAKPIIDSEEVEGESEGKYKTSEHYLFSVPITIAYKDFGGSRHYNFIIDDNVVTTNISFLNEYLTQNARDELFRFVAQSEASEDTVIPLSSTYIDQLWTKIIHLLTHCDADAKDFSDSPDMENTLVILLPKVNYFLSQDLLGIIDADDEEQMLDTSLSAWVNDQDMSVNESMEDNGQQELFFPFPYDFFQLQVLGKLGNRAAVVEGPPGTGKSQTIANIACHLAATGKKVLFVSQKDQAIRGVKDKLKTLDIPYLYGYLPDRSSRLHSEEDEIDSAANTLKGISQAFYSSSDTELQPKESLVKLYEYKPKFDDSIKEQREYFELYSEWLSLDAYEFGNDSLRISREWLNEIGKHKLELKKYIDTELKLESSQNKIKESKSVIELSLIEIVQLSKDLSKQFSLKTRYDWLKYEDNLVRGLDYAGIATMLQEVIDIFDVHVHDRKSNFIKSTINNIKLSKELDNSIEALPREMYESIKMIVFSDTTKTQRYSKLKEIYEYFVKKSYYTQRELKTKEEYEKLSKQFNENMKELQGLSQKIKEHDDVIRGLTLDQLSMNRIRSLLKKDGSQAIKKIYRRHELGLSLEDYKITNPNILNEIIMHEKSKYKTMVNSYLKNQLSERVQQYRQVKNFRAALESIGRKLGKSKRAYKTFDSLKSNPFNFEVMSGIIPVWMMGLDDASRVLPLIPNIFDYVIIDEASQCNISYAIPVMYRAKHTILFGDTLQMRDSTAIFKSNEQLTALANKHSIPDDLQIKASEDSVKSVMDIAKLSGFQTTVLLNHYRSPLELIGFSNEWFYEPIGRRLQVINDNVLAMEDGRVLKNHIISANPDIELSEKTNLSEAYYIKELITKIKDNPQTQDKSIAVLAFFNEQAELLRRVITDDDIKVSVIEGIQGDERDIIIYSLVIKSPEEKRRYTALTGEGGEIRKEANEGRVNVAFSRARLQVHVVTSIPPNLWPDGIWIKRYLEYVESKGRVNRVAKSDQRFDSKFEEHVYKFLSNTLDGSQYTLTTQVESCGFKIDLVIANIKTGKKLAIECDGPTHFELGDGQVRVNNDYERQLVLETAGWHFYRILYSDWQDEEENAKEELVQYIKDFMVIKRVMKEEDALINSSTYVQEKVEVPDDFIETIKTSMKSSPVKTFGRKVTSNTSESKNKIFIGLPNNPQLTIIDSTQTDDVYPEPVLSNNNPEPKHIVENKGSNQFNDLVEINLSPRRSIVISYKPDGNIWVNEKKNTNYFKGFTSKGFQINKDELSSFVDALSSAIKSENFEKSFINSNSKKLVVRSTEQETVDIRYFITSDKYTGYKKKGIRVIKSSAQKICDELTNILNSRQLN